MRIYTLQYNKAVVKTTRKRSTGEMSEHSIVVEQRWKGEHSLEAMEMERRVMEWAKEQGRK